MMTVVEAIRITVDMGEQVCLGYLQDLSDADLMRRAAPGVNHINWQVGHLILSEHESVSLASPGSMPALPEGFAAKYGREQAANDDPQAFCTKAELMEVFQVQRAAARAALEKTPPEDFDKPTGIPYAPTVAAIYSLLGTHWLMHAGQWAIVRRQLGKPPLF